MSGPLRPMLEVLLEPGAIGVVFQPIFECRGGERRLHALESLIRGPKGTNMENPEVMLEYARRKREEPRMDRACMAAALGAARELPAGVRVCLNVHASTLGRDPAFVEFLTATAAASGIAATRLTVEIVEQARPGDNQTFLASLERLRAAGLRIALDDIGLGYSNYKMVLDACPDYFKIDRYFVQGSHADPHRRAVLSSIAQLARRFGGRAVAEGVEETADLLAVLAQGIDLVQGFIFSPPLPAAGLVEQEVFGVFPPLPSPKTPARTRSARRH